VGDVLAALRLQSGFDQDAVDPAVQLSQWLALVHARPEAPGSAARGKVTDAPERDLEGRDLDILESRHDILIDQPIDLADEAHGQMAALWRRPARSGKP
jgi:hypothetical protein